jgi:serine/threonine-protein kinase
VASSPSSTESPASPAEIDELIAAGELLKAAAALRARGDLERAQSLFERGRDLQSAAAVASERRDLLGSLRIALLAQDAAALPSIKKLLLGASLEQRRQAAAIFEQHRLLLEAAELCESAGDLDAAHTLYLRSGGPSGFIGAARIAERRGQLLEAAQAYADAMGEDDDAASLEQLHAALSCGRVLLRCGRPEAAVTPLQKARRLARRPPASQDLLDEAELTLIECLVVLGDADIARPVLMSYATRHPEIGRPGTLVPSEFVKQRAESRNEKDEAALLLGRYRLLRLIGAGSMGRVYLAEDVWRIRRVALKLLPLSGASSRAQLALYRRFCREAQLLSGLRHPNLIDIEEFHAAAGVLAMEYMPAGALSSASLPLPLSTLRRILCEVLDALLLVHSAGILHRDIKPHNIFLSQAGTAKLADFGAASLRELGLTQTEGLVGTLAYMAPEQIRGETLSFATDVYGLGVTALELCTGRLPFLGPDFIEQHLHTPPPDARSFLPSLPAPWAELLRQLLQKSPQARCESLESLKKTLLALPTPDLPAQPRAAAPAPRPQPKQDTVNEPALVRHTPYSSLLLTVDARLGRPLLIERFASGLLQSEAGAAHLRWLFALARLAGPGMQRVLRIDLRTQPCAQVYFEAPSGTAVSSEQPLTDAEYEELRRILVRLHLAGVVHGGVERALIRQAGQPLFMLSGYGPLSHEAEAQPPPASDLASLQKLRRRG